MLRIVSIACFALVSGLQAQGIQVLPTPQKATVHNGNFVSNGTIPVYIDPAFAKGEYLLQALDAIAQIVPVKTAKKAKKGLQVIADRSISNRSEYHLEITKKHIVIRAISDEAVFDAIQTIRQLRSNSFAWNHDGKSFQKRELGSLPCVDIVDYPAYTWRGLHLDVSRHFFGVEDLKKYLDLMAIFKLNVFHWHLTDDQGWRIEIKKYPQLTSTGAWRNGSMVGRYRDNRVDSIRYGGFYTQAEIKEVVKYAGKLFITVVPEIEMPGHSLAAIASYPQYSCTGGPFEVAQKWGGFADVFCPGNDSAFLFLQDILSEVMELFPSEYIHIGGDECEKTRWKTCHKCKHRMEAEHLKDELELQSYFIRRMEAFVNGKGRKIIGWDEILEGGLAPNAAVMSWRGRAGGIAAAAAGHHVVMSPGRPCYFDHYQSKDSTEPIAIGGYNPLDSVYAFNPVKGMDLQSAGFVLGGQANVWTEYISTWSHVEYMVWPRAMALSDALWTAGNRDNYAAFLKVLQAKLIILDANQVHHAPHYGGGK